MLLRVGYFLLTLYVEKLRKYLTVKRNNLSIGRISCFFGKISHLSFSHEGLHLGFGSGSIGSGGSGGSGGSPSPSGLLVVLVIMIWMLIWLLNC